MTSSLFKILVFLALTSLVAGCKLTVHTGDGGNVQSLSGTRECTEGSNCVFDVTDTQFKETFTAVPLLGFEFVKWQAGDGFLCGNSHNPTCTVSTVGLTDQAAQAIIASDNVVRISPIFDRARDRALVLVDANDKFIGVPLDPGNVLVRFDGFSGAYSLSFDGTTRRLHAQATIFFTDSSCGMDGGEPYLAPPDIEFLLLVNIGSAGRDGVYYIPLEGAQTQLVIWNSLLASPSGTCDVVGRNLQSPLFPVVPVELEVAYPVRLVLR